MQISQATVKRTAKNLNCSNPGCCQQADYEVSYRVAGGMWESMTVCGQHMPGSSLFRHVMTAQRITD